VLPFERTEWHDKVERALQVLMDRVTAATSQAQSAEETAAKALAVATETQHNRPLSASHTVPIPQPAPQPAGGPYASEEMVFDALAGVQSSIESVQATAARALSQAEEAMRASAAASTSAGSAPMALRTEDGARLAAVEQSLEQMAPREKVSAALKKLSGDITSATDMAADAVARVRALEERLATTTASSVGAERQHARDSRDGELDLPQLANDLAAARAELAGASAGLSYLRVDVEELQRRSERMEEGLSRVDAAAAHPRDVPGSAKEAEDDRLSALSEVDTSNTAHGAEEVVTSEVDAVKDMQAALTALESRVEQLASDWGLGIIATQAASSEAPANARTLAELNACVLVIEARLEEIATDWGMASLMSAQSSAAVEKRVAAVEAAQQAAPDIAAALGIITPRVKQLETAVAALKTAAGEARQLASNAAETATSALELARAQQTNVVAPRNGDEEPRVTAEDVSSAVHSAIEPLREQVDHLQGVVSAVTAATATCRDDVSRCVSAVSAVEERIDAIESREHEAVESLQAHVKETETSVWQSVMLMREAVAAASSAPRVVNSSGGGEIQEAPRSSSRPQQARTPSTPSTRGGTPYRESGSSSKGGWGFSERARERE